MIRDDRDKAGAEIVIVSAGKGIITRADTFLISSYKIKQIEADFDNG
jgi:hypothetical protein